MNFGLEGAVPLALYSLSLLAILLAIFKKPIYGLYFIVPLIPLQTVRYRLNAYPLGASMVTLCLLAVIIGLMRRGEWTIKTRWTGLLISYCIFTAISLALGSLYLGEAFPIRLDGDRFSEWKDYMNLPLLLFVTAAAARTRSEMRVLVLLMCFSTLSLDKSFWGTVSDRDFSSYSADLREAGAMGYAGVNGLAAYEAEFTAFLLVLMGFEKGKLLRLAFLGLAGFSAVCLMYALSRGGYVAFLLAWLFIGLVQQRKLLILLLLFIAVWTSVVPEAVHSRITMTYDESGELDHSAETRVTLWEDALEIFSSNMLTGAGFCTYAHMNRVGNYKDTHNIFMKVLVETGVVGMIYFVLILVRFFASGWMLFRRTDDSFFKALGLGLAVWMLAAAAANFFGDRWTFLQVNGYMWVLAGMVSRAGMMPAEEPAEEQEMVEIENIPWDLRRGVPA